jgi:hypothetical protein
MGIGIAKKATLFCLCVSFRSVLITTTIRKVRKVVIVIEWMAVVVVVVVVVVGEREERTCFLVNCVLLNVYLVISCENRMNVSHRMRSKFYD